MPRGLFVSNEARRIGPGSCHADEIARAVRNLAIGNEQQFGSISRPRGVDRMIERTVIVAGDDAATVRDERTRRRDATVADFGDVEQKVAAPRGGYKRQAVAPRRP